MIKFPNYKKQLDQKDCEPRIQNSRRTDKSPSGLSLQDLNPTLKAGLCPV